MKDIQSNTFKYKILILDSDPDPFDWYQRFSGIKDAITPNFTPESVILNVGDGNSRRITF